MVSAPSWSLITIWLPLLVRNTLAIPWAMSVAPTVSSATPMGTLATAHPAKCSDAVEAATGQRPAMPPQLSALEGREEQFVEADVSQEMRSLATDCFVLNLQSLREQLWGR